MQYPLLITGTSTSKMNTIIELIPVDFYITNCPPNINQLEHMASRQNVRAFILCLNDEGEQSIRSFRVFLRSGILKNAELIIIGSKEDCKKLQRGGLRNDAEFFEYPLNVIRFQDVMRQLLEKLDEREFETRQEQPEFMQDDTARDPEPAPEHKHKSPGGASVGGESAERKRILAVDDDPKQLRLLKRMLSDFYDVSAVVSGVQARRYLETHKTDLILLDYLMEDENGIEVYNSLKENPETARIPVIFQTSVNTEHTVLNILQLKPQGYLIKPIKRADLLNRIIEALDNDV